jgi:peptidoglycan/xylan/chitin deacetylase (PgdA/CDA1 family)
VAVRQYAVMSQPRDRRTLYGRAAHLTAIVFTFLVMAAVLTWSLSNARCFVVTGSVLCRLATQRLMVALTFDDGPTAAGVRAILPILAQHDAKATFFLIGEQIEQRPDLARTLLVAGHEIGNHSYSHTRMILKSQAFYKQELARTDALIRAVGGRSGLFRPPYAKKLIGGDTGTMMIDTVRRGHDSIAPTKTCLSQQGNGNERA